ncbi:protein ALP1-like isoform X1 [Photinus pyralis]|nr:protein ALP1-like isoform X1 [Photinus pyralis]
MLYIFFVLNMECELAALTTLLLLKRIKITNKKKRRQRRWKVRYINRDRQTKGFYISTFLPMKIRDPSQFFKYTRMDVSTFTLLLNRLRRIVQVRKMNKPISVEERLVVTLHYLSQGSSMQTVAWKFKMGKSTVHCIIKEMCQAIFDVLHNDYLQPPRNEEEWLSIATSFENTWNFPHCLGALDGKHINMRAPNNSGSLYFNYKKNFSLVLLALCDSQYMFKIVGIGAFGSSSDGGVFQESEFCEKLQTDQLRIPRDAPIQGYSNQQDFPYFLVADAECPLGQHIMRPYPGHLLTEEKENFNKRLSRARRVVENGFGILAARWRILLQTINADPNLVEAITKACVCLHNFLRVSSPAYCPPDYVDRVGDDNGAWRRELSQPLSSIGTSTHRNSTHRALQLRDQLAFYLNGEGVMH